MLSTHATPATDATAVPAPPPPPPPPPPPRSAKAPARQTSPPRRDPFLDNAKYLAIVLVAAGHAWEPLREGSRWITALYTLVYAFHMPVFALISGYLSRGFEATPRNIGRLLTGIAAPYVLFETAYTFFTRWTSHDPARPITLLDPLYLTWFLAALFIWRLTTPIWQTLRHPLPIALTIAAAATLSPSVGNDLDLQRVAQFLPYFVLGLRLKPHHLHLPARREPRLLAVPLFAGALALAYWAVPRMNYAWFFHNTSATSLAAPTWYGPLMTLATFGCSVALVLGFLAWVPRRRTWFTSFGAGTLYGYLLHGFVAQAAEHWGWYDAGWIRGPAGVLAVTGIAAAVVTFLSAPAVRRPFRRAMEWAVARLLTH